MFLKDRNGTCTITIWLLLSLSSRLYADSLPCLCLCALLVFYMLVPLSLQTPSVEGFALSATSLVTVCKVAFFINLNLAWLNA